MSQISELANKLDVQKIFSNVKSIITGEMPIPKGASDDHLAALTSSLTIIQTEINKMGSALGALHKEMSDLKAGTPQTAPAIQPAVTVLANDRPAIEVPEKTTPTAKSET